MSEKEPSAASEVRSCFRCGKEKRLFSLNCAGRTVSGITYPGDPKVDYLCVKCQEALEPELKKQEHENKKHDEINLVSGLSLDPVVSWIIANPILLAGAIATSFGSYFLAIAPSEGGGVVNLHRLTLGATAAIVGVVLMVASWFVPNKSASSSAMNPDPADSGSRSPDRTAPVSLGTEDALPLSPHAASSSRSSAAASIPEKIRELGKLRDERLLSEDEFQAKKRELLAKM